MLSISDTLALGGAPCKNTPLVTDHQGNLYRTVQIGLQCWMAEDMRCTSSPSGKYWLYNPTFTLTAPLFSCYYISHNVKQYGYLYNWEAAMDVERSEEEKIISTARWRGICPTGWHLPTSNEWSQLVEALGGSKVAGGIMKCPSSLWESPVFAQECDCGFDALPAGTYTEDGMINLGYDATYWSSTSFDRNMAWYCGIYSYNNNSLNALDYKCYARSVRCVQD